MKKFLVLIAVVAAGVASMKYVGAQNDARPRQTGRFLQDARTEDGKIDLSKVLANDRLPQERKDAFKAADKDGDGFLTDEEYDNMPSLASAWRQKALEKELAELQEEQMKRMLFIVYSETQGRYYNSAEAFDAAFKIASWF